MDKQPKSSYKQGDPFGAVQSQVLRNRLIHLRTPPSTFLKHGVVSRFVTNCRFYVWHVPDPGDSKKGRKLKFNHTKINPRAPLFVVALVCATVFYLFIVQNGGCERAKIDLLNTSDVS